MDDGWPFFGQQIHKVRGYLACFVVIVDDDDVDVTIRVLHTEIR